MRLAALTRHSSPVARHLFFSQRVDGRTQLPYELVDDPVVEGRRDAVVRLAQLRDEPLLVAQHAREAHQLPRAAAVALLVELHQLAADVLARERAQARRLEAALDVRPRQVHFDEPERVAESRRLFRLDRNSTRLNSSHANISYAVF